MNIDRVAVRAFGRLSDVDTGEDSLPRLVVVQGPNEAGKSSLFTFLSALLYGFYPATRDANPHSPWQGENIDGEARIRLDDGETVVVHRRLLSSPWGRLTRNGTVVDLRNREVPWADHVTRTIFEQVYALTLADLARLEVETWRTVQDRLLGSLGAEDLRPVRDAVAELREEGSALWRPDRRGKPAVEALEERRKELRRQAHDARRRDETLREKVKELRVLQEDLVEARRRRDAREAEHTRATVLGPVRERLERIRELEEEAGDTTDIDDLPADPRGTLEEMRRDVEAIEKNLQELRSRREQLRRRVDAFGTQEGRLIERGEEIRRLVVEAGAVRHARTRIEQIEVRTRSLERRRDMMARELLGVSWGELDREALDRISGAELRERIARFSDAARDARAAEDRLRALGELEPPEVEEGPPIVEGLLVVIAVGTAVVAAPEPSLPLLGIAAALLVMAAVQLVQRRRNRRRRAARSREHRRRVEGAAAALDDAKDEVAERRRAVREALSGLSLPEGIVERPTARLVDGLQALREVRNDLHDLNEERRGLQDRIDSGEARIAAVGDRLEVELPPDFVGAAARLEEALREAERRRDHAEDARRALSQEASPDDLVERREKCTRRLADLRERLEDLGGTLEEGISEVEERRAALERARSFQRELEIQHPNLPALKERISEAEACGEGWALDKVDGATAARRVREITEEIEEQVTRAESLRHEIDDLRDARDLADVEGEIAAVEEEMAELRRERDRLHLAAEIVRVADHRFRERHQPDLLRHASRHLSRITGGRYDRIWIRESELDGTLLLRGPEYPHPVEVAEPVSDGTRDQVYLALRLAIVDHLDEGRESLPLFIDEAFVKWDPRRRTRGFDVLARMSERRQIFVFTCHEPMARSLQERGARLLRLEGPS